MRIMYSEPYYFFQIRNRSLVLLFQSCIFDSRSSLQCEMLTSIFDSKFVVFLLATTHALHPRPMTHNIPASPTASLVIARADTIKRPSAPIVAGMLDPALKNGSNDRDHVPICNPLSLFPITNPADCNEAKRELLHASGALEPTDWYISQRWTYHTCDICLLPIQRHRAMKDTFSRLDIARDAQFVIDNCVTQSHGFRGGSIVIGEGLFEVAVLGRAQGGSWWDGVVKNENRVAK